MQCPRCQHDGRPAAKFCEQCGTPLTPPNETRSPAASYDELQCALTEAIDQQSASGEILRVISRSAADVQSVFETIARSAVALTSADLGGVLRREGREFHLAALHGIDGERLDGIREMFAPASVGLS